jgi:hypothetical protein
MWNSITERWAGLALEQKISVGVLSLCGLLAIGLSLFRLRATINEPFLVRKESLLETKELIGDTEEQKLAVQQRTDTDGDGLSDWDEVNTYGTNPNLRDTCGDGTPDNVRIATGKGANCDIPAASTGLDTSIVNSTSSVLSPIALPNPQDTASPQLRNPQQLVQDALPRDPKAIRELLSGKVDAAELEQLTDEDLLKLYDAALAQAQETTKTATASSTTSTR